MTTEKQSKPNASEAVEVSLTPNPDLNWEEFPVDLLGRLFNQASSLLGYSICHDDLPQATSDLLWSVQGHIDHAKAVCDAHYNATK